jgi:lysophospholipase L1-like esterase
MRPQASSRKLQASGLIVTVVLLALSACKRDGWPPVVASTFPENGKTGIPINTRIRVTFSDKMDTASCEAAFSLTPAASGSFQWAGNSVYWRPAQDLAAQTAYSFVEDTAARDLAGQRLEYHAPVTSTTGDTAAVSVMVYMLGRSVMGGWFSHLGGSPYSRDRSTLEYHEVQPPPDVVANAGLIIDSLALCDRPVLFFKLCFVDFEGGDSATAQANLDRNVEYVRQVYDSAHQRGLLMIAGNALPQVAASHDPWLTWNHRQYNQQLVALAARHPDSLAVFDLYGVLTDTAGNLKPGYATGPGDSHPNDAGYSALDSAFFPFLEQRY